MAATKVGRGSDQFPLRLPDGLRERIKASADQSGRSMNAEIIARLESSYESNVDPKALSAAFSIAEDMRARVEAQWDYLRKVDEDLNEERRKMFAALKERRKEIADYIWEKRAAVREEIRRRTERLLEGEERLRERQRLFLARMSERKEELYRRERELDEAITRFNSREKELATVIRSLTKGATDLSSED
jgi:Flagellar capping protein